MRSLLSFALTFRVLVVALAAGLLALGAVRLPDAPVDVLPEFTPPYVEIQTEALGLSAEEVEQLVTVPMEADLLNGVEGIDVLRSKSVPGLSSIVLVFEHDADLYTSRQLVQERLTQMGAAAMPNVSSPPVMLQPFSSSSRLLVFGLASDAVSPIEMSVIARWTLQPRLLGVPGVASVNIWGFRDRQLQVQVDPERLRDRGVTLQQVVDSTGNAQISTPLSHLEGSTPGTGGFIETPQQRLGIRNVFDKLTSPAELAKVPVEGTGGRMQLSDVATVVEDHQPLIGDAVVGDGDGLLLVVEKFPAANTVEVTRGVEAALEDLRPGLAGMRPDTSIFRPATFVEQAIDNLALAAAIAAALLVLALAAFLYQWRTLLVCLFTIPLSLAAAGLVLDGLGETFNAISLAGLAVALALVIDDAVAGTENVARRLRLHRQHGGDATPADVVREATHEVRAPLMYAALIALLAIVPLAVMQGRPGAFFEPLAVAYAAAIATGTLVALTVTPALCLLLFSRGGPARGESPLLRALRPRYDGALARVIHRPRRVLIAVAATTIAGVAVLPALGFSPVPAFKDRDLIVHLDAEPGTSNPRMTEIATQVSRELREIAGVSTVAAHVGRAIGGDQIVDVNSGDVLVGIDPEADRDATLAAIEAVVAGVPGVRGDVVAHSEQKIRDVGALREGENPVTGDGLDVLTGSSEPLVVRVYGEELGTLRREAAKVRQMLAGIDGVVAPRVEQPVEQPTVEIEVDLDRARRWGIKPGDVRRAEATLVQGLLVGSVFEEQKVFEVVVRGTPETRRSPADVRNLLLDAPGGRHVRLGEVADVTVRDRPIAIERESVSRYLDVTAGVSGRGLDAVAGDIDARLKGSAFPLEYHAEVLTPTTASEIERSGVIAAAITAALAALLLLQAAFRSWRLALLVFLALPAGLAGGVLAALIDGAELTLGALAAFLALLGLAARNALLLVRRFQEMERYEGAVFGASLVRRGARDRLGPIVTTAASVGLIALVLVVLGSRPGLEIVGPMAVVLLGGLVTTTLLSLFALPALYLGFGSRQPEPSPEEELMQRWAAEAPAVAAGPEITPDVEAVDSGGEAR